MPALLIDLQANWREYAEHLGLGLLLGSMAGAAIVGIKLAGLLG